MAGAPGENRLGIDVVGLCRRTVGRELRDPPGPQLNCAFGPSGCGQPRREAMDGVSPRRGWKWGVRWHLLSLDQRGTWPPGMITRWITPLQRRAVRRGALDAAVGGSQS